MVELAEDQRLAVEEDFPKGSALWTDSQDDLV